MQSSRLMLLWVHSKAEGQTLRLSCFMIQELFRTGLILGWSQIPQIWYRSLFHFQSGWMLCRDEKENAPSLLKFFVSYAKDSFEKVCLSAVHSRVLFCVSLRFSLSVSEIEKEISQLKTKETVSFLQTFIYFPLFVWLCRHGSPKRFVLAPGEDVIFLNLNYYMTAKTEKKVSKS